MGDGLFEYLLDLERTNTKLKLLIRNSSSTWLSWVGDARLSDGSTNYQMNFFDKPVDLSDLYSKEDIQDLIAKNPPLEDLD